jgi:hypothetical protein
MNFDQIVAALSDAEVRFVIIGGWAAIIHGSAYATQDLDICYSREPQNLQRLAKALAPFQPRLRDLPESLPFIWDETTLRNGTTFTLTTDLGAMDLLAEVAGLGAFAEVEAASISVNAFGRRVRALDLRGLIKSKRAAGRPKDALLLPELESLLEAGEE